VSGLPRLPDTVAEADISILRGVAEMWQLNYLVSVCDNLTKVHYKNPEKIKKKFCLFSKIRKKISNRQIILSSVHLHQFSPLCSKRGPYDYQRVTGFSNGVQIVD